MPAAETWQSVSTENGKCLTTGARAAAWGGLVGRDLRPAASGPAVAKSLAPAIDKGLLNASDARIALRLASFESTLMRRRHGAVFAQGQPVVGEEKLDYVTAQEE